VDAARSSRRVGTGRAAGWRTAAAIARGLVIAAPLVAVFGALFIAADAVFAELVANALRFDFQWIASHILVFSILAWLSTGYLRSFLTGTELPPLGVLSRDGAQSTFAPKRPALGITEVATALAARGPEYEAIAKLSREIIEQVVWEVVPELAEAIIRQEVDRLAAAKR